MKPETTSLIVKVNFLLLGFGLVVYLIWYLNYRGLPEGAQSLMGLEGGHKVTLCKTRVNAIQFGDSGRIFEENMTWKVAPEAAQLNQLAMEKWFGKYCTVTADPLSPEEQPDGSPGTEIVWSFVDGANESLEIWPDQKVFSFAGAQFKSAELAAALAELAQLAGLKTALISGQ